MIVISKLAGSMLSAPRSACCPAPPSSRVMTVATRIAPLPLMNLTRPRGTSCHPACSLGVAGGPQASRPGHPDRLQAAVHVKLGEDVPGMRAHRVGGNLQVLGDLAA